MKSNYFGSRMIFLGIAIHFLPLTGRGAIGDIWVRKANLPTPRMGLSTCVVNGTIYALGGASAIPNDVGLSLVHEYTPPVTPRSWSRGC